VGFASLSVGWLGLVQHKVVWLLVGVVGLLSLCGCRCCLNLFIVCCLGVVVRYFGGLQSYALVGCGCWLFGVVQRCVLFLVVVRWFEQDHACRVLSWVFCLFDVHCCVFGWFCWCW